MFHFLSLERFPIGLAFMHLVVSVFESLGLDFPSNSVSVVRIVVVSHVVVLFVVVGFGRGCVRLVVVRVLFVLVVAVVAVVTVVDVLVLVVVVVRVLVAVRHVGRVVLVVSEEMAGGGCECSVGFEILNFKSKNLK